MTRVAPGAEQRRARVCGTPPFHVEPTAVTGRKAACLRRSRGGEWSPWAPCGDARGRVGRGRAHQDGAAVLTPGRERAPGTPVDGAATGTASRDATSARRRVGWGRRSPCDERRRDRAPRCPRFAAVLGAGARRVSRRGLRERRAGLCRPCGGPRCDVFHVKRSRGSRYRVRRTVRSSGAPIERPSGDTVRLRSRVTTIAPVLVPSRALVPAPVSVPVPARTPAPAWVRAPARPTGRAPSVPLTTGEWPTGDWPTGDWPAGDWSDDDRPMSDGVEDDCPTCDGVGHQLGQMCVRPDDRVVCEPDTPDGLRPAGACALGHGRQAPRRIRVRST